MNAFDASSEYRQCQRQSSLTDLHEAVLDHCPARVQKALANGVLIDEIDHGGQTALHYASERGFHNIVRLLLEHAPLIDAIDSNEASALWAAARKGHGGIVRILLKGGACPDKKAKDDTTALYHASYEGHHACVYHLVRFGASVNLAKNSGATPLFVASRNGHHRIVKHLLKNGADPTLCQADQRSALHTAFLYNKLSCARLLLRHSSAALIEQTDMYGCGHLHFLAKKGSVKGARMYFHYLDQSNITCNVSQVDRFGNTPLHVAALKGRTKFSKFLIAKGFDPNQANASGWTPKSITASLKQKPIEATGSPKEYLYHLLNTRLVRYTEEDDSVRHEVENYVHMLAAQVTRLDPLFRSEIIRSGSFYEGTRVLKPDEFDFMINLVDIEHLCAFGSRTDDPAGFGRLYPLDTPAAREKLGPYLEPNGQYLSSQKIRKRFYHLLTSARAQVICKESLVDFERLKFEWTSGDKRCGTAIQAEWHGAQYPCLPIKIDVVPCLRVLSWPETANVVCPMSEPEFHVIPRSPKASLTFLWRVSTSRAELAHFHSLPAEIQNAYRSLKCLRSLEAFTQLSDKSKCNAEELITSYMFKTEFLHEAARHPHPAQWIGGGLIHRVLSILKQLDKHLQLGSIKSYYIKDYNVVDADDYAQFRSQEIGYIRRLRAHLIEKVKAMNLTKPRRHTCVETSPIASEHASRARAFSAAP